MWVRRFSTAVSIGEGSPEAEHAQKKGGRVVPAPAGRRSALDRLQLADLHPRRIDFANQQHINRSVTRLPHSPRARQLRVDLLWPHVVEPAGTRIHDESDESAKHDVAPDPAT